MLRKALIFLAVIAALYAGLVLLLALQQDALVFPGAGRGDRGIGFLPRVRALELQRLEGVAFRIAVATPEGEAVAMSSLRTRLADIELKTAFIGGGNMGPAPADRLYAPASRIPV